MKIRKNYNASMAIMLVVIALSLVGGCYRSLGREARKVEKVFYKGEDDHSGQADYAARTGLCSNLLVVADRYLPTDDPAYTAMQTTIGIAKEAGDMWEVVNANSVMTKAFESLYLTLEEYDLSDSDKEYREELREDFTSYGYILRHDPYNTEAVDYNQEVLGAFPARYLGGLLGVKPLPTFS